jgi:hypothetical protein
MRAKMAFQKPQLKKGFGHALKPAHAELRMGLHARLSTEAIQVVSTLGCIAEKTPLPIAGADFER